MDGIDPQRTFRGLPLTPEQDAEVRHYIKKQKQRSAPWDTPELAAMLADMLRPPSNEDEDFEPDDGEGKAAAERAAGAVDDEMDPIEAGEERIAAMEAEAMKGPKH
ncbi:hypothetical protein AB4156_26420 [Cupriavidus sp. 2MCAB6]|uniref:hypothetical protein n=1 Tax=Cupriavidus sp. 2MCAB6 TaxID=3232981 RepID=UPI003F93EA7B